MRERVPCLLLPGLLDDARLWHHQVASLSALIRPVVADLTGADSMAALAESALDQAPAGRFVLAGLSMGGYVAMEIMRRAPERVAALALLDTTARPDTPEATASRRKLMALAETDFPAVTRTLMAQLVHPERRGDRALVQVITSMADDIGKEAFVRQQHAIIGRVDSRPALAGIECPVLVLCGREDAITPVEAHEEMAEVIPDAGLVVVERCGHMSTLERPEQVSGAMKKWLNSM
jgi:pimeloyl-ACP methyl ester carboxylesterase